jgi:hypothetical protein
MAKPNRINISSKRRTGMTDPIEVSDEAVNDPIIESPAPVVVQTTDATSEPEVSEVIAPQAPAAVQETPVQPAPVVAPVGALQPGSRVYTIAVSAQLSSLLGTIESTYGPVALVGLMQVFEYIEHMKPGKTISVSEGVRRQADLLRGIKNIIENSGSAFPMVFSALLKTVDEHSGNNAVFNDKYLFRFFENVSMSTTDQQAFRRLMNLFKVTAPVNQRTNLGRVISFTKSLQYGLTEAGKQRILNYYQV